MTRLRSCNACSRHVFATESQCPFCGALLAVQDSAPIFNLKAGMSRAQRFALVAAVAGQTLVGCSKTTTPGTGAGSAGQGATSGQAGTSNGQAGTAGDSGGGRAQPVYGAPVTPVNPGTPGGHAGTGGNVAIPVYGAPVAPLDAGEPRDSGAKSGDEDAGADASTDAGKDAGPRFHPVYGAPIPIYGAPPRKE